jgi:hypothetical protein
MKKLRGVIAIAWLALLILPEPASAQVTYPLVVSRHPSVQFSEDQVDSILAAASKMLQKVDRPQAQACNVTFKRSGPIRTFASPNTPAVITNAKDRDAVHRENFDSSVVNIKIVDQILFCRRVRGISGQGVFRGCSWPEDFRSIIVTVSAKQPELVWPHEFGHQTGLWHREDDASHTVLMSPCPLRASNVQVTQDECDCLQKGPGGCHPPEPNPRATCDPHRQ